MKGLQEVYFSNLNAVCNTGGKFLCAPDYVWSIHTHSFSQNKFYFITSGTCIIEIEGKEYTATAGQWFFIPAGAKHAYHNLPGCSFQKYWMHFDLYPTADLFSLLELPFFVNVPEDSSVYSLFDKAVQAMNSAVLTDRIHLKTCLFNLLSEYICLVYPDGITVENPDDRIEQVLRYINSNLARTLSVPELAKHFGLHPTHFIRFFRSKTGYTPAQYVRLRRLETAKRLLESTDMYIGDIMDQVGIHDESLFSRQFKKHYSLSPRNYRTYFKKNLNK